MIRSFSRPMFNQCDGLVMPGNKTAVRFVPAGMERHARLLRGVLVCTDLALIAKQAAMPATPPINTPAPLSLAPLTLALLHFVAALYQTVLNTFGAAFQAFELGQLRANFLLGIAAKSDEHLRLLQLLTRALGETDLGQALRRASTPEALLKLLQGAQSSQRCTQ